jgi:predicted ATPase
LLVADLQLGKNSTFMTSQPEIHLHPRIQAEYVNHLVKSAKSSNKRYVIETHSEYLLNRFRLLIAKGKIKSEDVAVYYLTRSGTHVRSYRLTFEKDGTIRGAPKGFFETYMMDAMEIALHAEA